MAKKKTSRVISCWVSKLRYLSNSRISILSSKLKKSILKIRKGCNIQFNEATISKSSLKLSGECNAQINGELYKCIVDISGKNNELLIENGCNLRNLTIIIKGNSCTVKIKKNTSSNGGCIVCMGKANHVHIGESCMFADNVDIWASDTHPIFNENNELINPSAPIDIEDNVWIGRHGKVLKGVCIQEGAVIGMGSIVTRNILAHSLNVGAPAKCIKNNITWNRGCIADFE